MRCARKLRFSESIYLDSHDGTGKRDKLIHEVRGLLRITGTQRINTVTNQRGDVVKRVSLNRLTRAPITDTPVEPRQASLPQHVTRKNVGLTYSSV